jgi:hypothetical protein
MSVADEFDLAYVKLTVEHGGGEFVGIQQTMNEEDPLVLFNEAKRTGLRRRYPATMAMKLSNVTPHSVHDHIVAKNAEFARARLPKHLMIALGMKP